MAVAEDMAEAPRKPGLKQPLMVGILLALIGAGGGFFAIRAGWLALGPTATVPESTQGHDGTVSGAESIGKTAFVAVDPLVISLGEGSPNRHLRFRAQLEVPTDRQAEVTHLMPRVVDVLNSYLRALDIADLEDRTALMRLRSQMLRRVQIVTGPDRVSDLLIMEFVFN